MKEDLFSHLPEKEKLKIIEINPNIKEEQKKLIEINKEYLESKLWTWKKDENFVFSLPPTIFTTKNIIKNDDNLRYRGRGIEYENPNLIGHHFTREILSQIWQRGEFKINSIEPGFPYTWKLSGCTVKGIQNLKLRYKKDMSKSFLFLYSLYYRFSTYNYKEIFPLSFPSAIYNVYVCFYKSLDIIFGLPKFSYNDKDIELNIKKQRIQNFVQLNNDLDFSFFNPQNQQKLKEIDEEFNKKWISEIQPGLMKNYKEQNLNKEQTSTNLAEDKKREFLDFLAENQNFREFEEFHRCSKDYVISQQIINDAEFFYNLEKEKKIENYKNELEKCYIRNLCDLWHEDKLNSYTVKITNQTLDEIEKKIKREIQNKKDPSCVYYYNTNNRKEIPKLLEKQRKKEKVAHNIHIKRYLARPYPITQVETTDSNIRYELKKYKYYKVNTSFCCWRIILFLIKYFCIFWNYNLFIYRQMTDSMFGIKALFFCELYRDYDINHSTGVMEKTNDTITFAKSLSNLWTWISESRSNFEKRPDTGILGKGCSRIFHLFLNYILRLLIIGSLLIICYPTLIFSNVFICLCLIIFSPILVTLWIIGDYLFCLFCYNRYDEDIKEFPLCQIILGHFFFGFIFQILANCFSIIIVQPFLTIFLLLYAQIHFLIRFFYDVFFFCILACFGRIPESNNCIAWVTGGPGLFIERYFDIQNKDILSLVIGELEKKIMNNYQAQMERLLDSPENTLREIQNIYLNIGLTYSKTTLISNNISFYKTKLQDAIRQRNLYPECRVSVKFTEERLDEVINMIELYITEYSKLHDISFELNKFEDNKIANLAKEIMKTIFGNSIFVPLQSTEKVFHIKSVFKNQLDVIATRLFENPLFDDKIIVEERPKEIKENKIVKLPEFANFSKIFQGDLNLDLSNLKEQERENLIKNDDDLLLIKT